MLFSSFKKGPLSLYDTYDCYLFHNNEQSQCGMVIKTFRRHYFCMKQEDAVVVVRFHNL
jgi:hypothetical protein